MKTCFKCGESKDISEFYVHPQMGDGTLGKCKTCTKSDSRDHYKIKRLDLDWVNSERERGRAKISKYRADGREVRNSSRSALWDKSNPQKKAARNKAIRAVKSGLIKRETSCSRCGTGGVELEMHHDDYAKPIDVEFLCLPCHGKTRRKTGPIANTI